MAADPEIDLGPRDYHLARRDGQPVAFHEAFAPKAVELERRPVWPGRAGLLVGAALVVASILLMPSFGYVLGGLAVLASLGMILLSALVLR